MEAFLPNSGLKEVSSLGNVAYLLENENDFSATEYKILQSQEDCRFIECIQLKYNGKIKLFYMSSKYSPLFENLSSLEEKTFLSMISNLLFSLVRAKENGFLNVSKVLLERDKIFVDKTNHQVWLIYLPLVSTDFQDKAESDGVRKGVLRILEAWGGDNSKHVNQIAEALENADLQLEEIYRLSVDLQKGDNKQGTALHKKNKTMERFSSFLQKEPQPILTLQSTDIEKVAALHIDKSEYIIGKNPNAVDGVIEFNNAVSRIHCKIIYKNKKYYVVDMNSANGTFVNAKRLAPNKPEVIVNGDLLKLANSEFLILI